MVVGRLRSALDRPVDAASCAAFRIGFGALLFVSTLRFFVHGWIREYYVEPTHFFHYYGLSWLRPLPGYGMYAVYAVLASSAICILLGFAYRAAASCFAVAFTYAHLCDKANYLNHYYLISLLAVLLAVLPLDSEYSLRVRRHPDQRRGRVRAWILYLLRFQIGVVYVFGGLGKLEGDWLSHGEPLRIWLAANAELPLIGPWLSTPRAALVFSWCGAAFDLAIVPLLSCRSTRMLAYVGVLLFHGLTAALFPIGMFPWLMIFAVTIFWSPDWPRRASQHWSRRERRVAPGIAGEPLAGAARAGVALYAAVQLLVPLRSRLYPGNTLWTEEGFRFSWKVMLIEKAGSLEFNVVDASGHSYVVSPREYLTPLQARMAATQPDMILELAHWIARDFSHRGLPGIRVYADSEVAFNGRQRRRFVDPTRDLSRVSDSLTSASWLLPAPTDAPSF